MVDEENKVPAAAASSRGSNKRAFDSIAITNENDPLQISERPYPANKKRVVLGELNNLGNVAVSTQNSDLTETHESKRKIKLRKTTTRNVVKETVEPETSANSSPKDNLQKCSYGPLIYQHLHSLEILVVTREMVHIGMVLLKYLPISLVDTMIAKFAKFKFGKLEKFGIPQPEEGTSPVIDVGAIDKIKLEEIKEHTVMFENGEEFDAIIFATGYKNVATKWLKDYSSIFLDDGTLMNEFPNHWKGENGLYCAGFSKRGLAGISMDAITIVDDIKTVRGDKI
ncbi:hypothetical protein KY290_025977 [Solanum tuberosum]|uniref:Flavin-containing monooxygenase n=1 Tax=Solanum tuberosum TaxID=4113 RepID=A0ABQ7UX84_SOLTU|nr:hypothetical protein KY290_025977 [Solanum tuberosum]